MQKPLAEKGEVCPLHRVDVSKVCHKCPWWTLVRGKHPQSMEMIDKWGCAIAWMPVLAIEGAQMTRQTGAAVESFRNEFVDAGKNMVTAISSQQSDMLRLRGRDG
jgi:hypothetical protein